MSSRIGDTLLQLGLIDEDQLLQAQALHDVSNEFFGNILIKSGFITEETLLNTLSKEFDVPIIDLELTEFDTATLDIVPQSLVAKHGIIPIEKKDSTLLIMVYDPSNFAAITELRFITGLDIHLCLTSYSLFKSKQDLLFEKNSLDQIMNEIALDEVSTINDEAIDLDELAKATEDAPIVRLANAILVDSIKKRASDIHIEPYEKSFRVRFRIDGVLYEIMRPPMKLKNALISRLKIMANLDIAERRLPQDGRIKLKLPNGGEMDFRVNCLPTLFGEKVVLRLLDKSNLQLDMEKLGFFPEQLHHFQEAISRPHGLILVTGPTGSGKTTTLYSALSELNKTAVNISTAEDPVEYNLQGINQAQMHDDIGFNFAAALRAFLRQDPDVIMVGEIRDYETAEIAIKASLTGHLVLSTLHTNDAPATVSRLLNMGVEPFLVTSSVSAIIAQRLARRICQNCITNIEIPEEILLSIGLQKSDLENLTIKQGTGCPKCSHTGYKGRVALYEVLVMSEKLKELILSGGSNLEIKKQAIIDGMLTLRASALIRLKEGLTTLEEVVRVTAED